MTKFDVIIDKMAVLVWGFRDSRADPGRGGGGEGALGAEAPPSYLGFT